MQVLKKVSSSLHSFEWVNYDYLPDSEGFKFEIYLSEGDESLESLMKLFYNLFDQTLVIGQPSLEAEWGQLCLDTWDFENDEPDYDFTNKSSETIDYLNLLLESRIGFDYRGLCECRDWDVFLRTILKCVLNHKAPYSPIFYNKQSNYIFYFHHTFSIGVLYKEKNAVIQEIVKSVKEHDYKLKDYFKV